jgi:sigma-B regulation protein RsbU (phosphoserine phosphatase)
MKIMQTNNAPEYLCEPDQSPLVLVVEDNAAERIRLQAMVQKLGYGVVSAADGLEALQHIAGDEVDIIISDWKMPAMDGLTLCRTIRSDKGPKYPYFIMLTGCDSKADLIAGMDAGADDFVTKPFNNEELRVRLKAGSRIQQLKQQIGLNNARLEKANRELKQAEEILNKDLNMAAHMQQELLPREYELFDNCSAASIFQPASSVSGDMFNIFRINDQHLAFYHFDVSGHGVSAAMLSFTLARLIGGGPGAIDESIGTQHDPEFGPAAVVEQLNARFQSDRLHTPYFTIIYGILNTQTGEGELCQAGHPHPLIMRSNADIERLGSGGFPVGALDDAGYENVAFMLNRGDRLFIYSDGISECGNEQGELFGENRLTAQLKNVQKKSVQDQINIIQLLINRWRGSRPQEDDISALLIEYNPVHV